MPATLELDARQPDDLAQAVALLRQGRLVALPTETVYGLAADAGNDAAVSDIFAAKGRPTSHPLIVHLADAAALDQWARTIPDAARLLATRFWPGPLTLLLPKASGVSERVTGGSDAVGLRVPAQAVMREVLQRFGGGLAAPSANPYRGLSPTRAAHVLAGLSGRIDAVLDGGPCAMGLESSIVDLSGDLPLLVRPGPISRAALEAALGRPLALPHTPVQAPGTDAVHYRPRAPLRVLDQDALASAAAAAPDAALVVYGDHDQPVAGTLLRCLSADPEAYARELYRTLHDIDALQPTQILVLRPPSDAAWAAVNDRLARASGNTA